MFKSLGINIVLRSNIADFLIHPKQTAKYALFWLTFQFQTALL